MKRDALVELAVWEMALQWDHDEHGPNSGCDCVERARAEVMEALAEVWSEGYGFRMNETGWVSPVNPYSKKQHV